MRELLYSVMKLLDMLAVRYAMDTIFSYCITE